MADVNLTSKLNNLTLLNDGTSTSARTNAQIMAENLLEVQNIQNKETSFADRSKHLAPELAIGVPVTGTLVTFPYWSKSLKKPYSAWTEMRANKGMNYFDAWKSLNAKQKAATGYLTENLSWLEGRKNLINYNKLNQWNKDIPNYNSSKKLSELSAKEIARYNKRLCYSDALKLIEEAKTKKLTGTALKEQMNKILNAMREGDIKVNQLIKDGAIKPTSLLGKTAHAIKGKTGYYSAKGAILSSTKGASALRMASKCSKGSGIFAIIGGLLEIPNLISAHQADKAEKANGNNNSNYLGRQVVKSTVKVGAGVLGYAAGAAAAGAVAGSVCPVIGNVAGAIIGFVGGCIGGLVLGYGADKLVGEKTASEEYLAKVDAEKKAKALEVAKESETNTDTNNQLLQAMYQKIESGGVTDKEVLTAFETELKKRYAQLDDTNTTQVSNTDYSSGNYTQNYYSQQAGQNSGYSMLLGQLEDIKNTNMINFAA